MTWEAVFVALGVSHLVGDYVLQTDWQARHKRGGLGRDPLARRALLTHVAIYTLAFVPVLIWALGDVTSGLLAALAIGVPHLVQDDGRLLAIYVRRVKGNDPPEPRVFEAVDQSLHVTALFLLALVVAA